MKKVVIMASCFVLGMAAVSLAGDYENIPDGMKGFSGMLRGKVVAKVDNGFILKVEKILKLWDGNKAKNPKSAVGKRFLVVPRWVKGDNGKWHPVELHVKFIRRLEVGQVLNIEVRHEEGKKLNILELSGEQRKWAAGGDGEKEGRGDKEKEKEKDLPKKGVVAGEVVFLKDTSFKLKVREASRGAQMLEGETLHFFVNWIKKGDKWVPDPKEVRVLGQLRLGYTVKVEFFHDGEHWRIKKLQVLKKGNNKRREELGKKQRQEEEREKKQREKEGREKEEQAKKERQREEKEKREEEKEPPKAEKHEGGPPKNWPKEGSVYGVVTGIGATTISVKVLKASDNAKAMVGETVTFYVNWVKNDEGKWVPDPEEVALIKSLELEDKVEIRFYFEEHYRIRKLEKG